MCVRKDYRGKKVSQRMIEKYIDLKVNVGDSLELSVNFNNPMYDIAVKSYANIGFKNPNYEGESIRLSYTKINIRQLQIGRAHV